MLNPAETAAVLKSVADALQRLGVPYFIGGSVASSSYGMARSTLDVDMVTNLRVDHIKDFIQSLNEQFYVSEEQMRSAIELSRSFNILHLATGLKIDIFIKRKRPYDDAAFLRAKEDTLSEGPGAPLFYLSSPEDVILAKIEWFKLGNLTSIRQWEDILGILRVQGDLLDFAYLRKWSKDIGVADLFEKALSEK